MNTQDEPGPAEPTGAMPAGSAPFSGGTLPVAALVADSVVRVPPDATLRQVAEVLAGSDVGAVVLGTGDAADAIVSERDIARAVAAGRDPETTRAAEVGSTDLVWVDAEATVAEAARHMMSEYVRHAFVRDGSRLAGIVSARDLLGAFASDPDLPDEDA